MKNKIFSVTLVLAMILAMVSTSMITASAATNYCKLSINKTEVKIGETFTFTCDANPSPSQYWFSIYNTDTGNLVISGHRAKIYSDSFLSAGPYAAYMSNGYQDSNWVNFYVYGSAPTSAQLTPNKTSLSFGESIYFTPSHNAYYARVYISIYNTASNTLVYNGEIKAYKAFTFTPSASGTYSATISAYTPSGTAHSSWVYFTVGAGNKPTNPQISIDKGNNGSYALNDTVKFTYSATNATGYTIGIDRDGKRILTQEVPATGFSYKCTSPGNYSAYVTSWNNVGYTDSSRVNFTVNGGSGQTNNLSLAKLRAYANKNWDSGVGLCAEYVYNCLSAAGLTLPNINYADYKGRNYSVKTWAPSQLKYFVEQTSYEIIWRDSHASPPTADWIKQNIEPGDVIYYEASEWKKCPDHVVICVGRDSTGFPLFSAHNSAHKGDNPAKDKVYASGSGQSLLAVVKMNMYN